MRKQLIPLGGVHGTGNPNLQGILLSDIMDRHNLCAVSQCEWATGPLHTYVSGNSMTTVDYIIASRCHLYNIIM